MRTAREDYLDIFRKLEAEIRDSKRDAFLLCSGSGYGSFIPIHLRKHQKMKGLYKMNRLKEKKETLKGAVKKLAVFIMVLFVMTAASGFVVLADTNGDFEYSVDGDEVTITRYNGEGGDVVIPGTIEGKSVTSIGVAAFSYRDGLTSVEIPSSVMSIGDEAFAGCSGLISVEIPSSVTSIGNFAFGGCDSLTSVEIPSSVTSIG